MRLHLRSLFECVGELLHDAFHRQERIDRARC